MLCAQARAAVAPGDEVRGHDLGTRSPEHGRDAATGKAVQDDDDDVHVQVGDGEDHRTEDYGTHHAEDKHLATRLDGVGNLAGDRAEAHAPERTRAHETRAHDEWRVEILHNVSRQEALACDEGTLLDEEHEGKNPDDLVAEELLVVEGYLAGLLRLVDVGIARVAIHDEEGREHDDVEDEEPSTTR